MKLFREVEFIDGRIVKVPISLWYGNNQRFGPLLIVAAAVMAGGQIMQGQAAATEGKSAHNMANYNALVAEREGEAIKQAGRFRQSRQAKTGDEYKSALETKINKEGGGRSDVKESIMWETEKELQLEQLMTGYEFMLESQRKREEAAWFRIQGDMAKQKGKNIQRASYLQAGGTLLTGFGMAGAYGEGSPSYAKGGVAGGGGKYGQNYFNYTTRP